MYLIFRYLNRDFEEINGNKYLTLIPNNESKEKNTKYEELWINIRDLISDDELPLNKTIEIPTITIVVRAFFLKKTNIIHKFS